MDSTFVADVMKVLEAADAERVKTMILNYRITGEKFEDAFDLIKYRLGTENPGFSDSGFAVQAHLIVMELETYFAEQNREAAPKQKKQQKQSVVARPEQASTIL
jgi:hypothetical protein